jgi:hypothetical protein
MLGNKLRLLKTKVRRRGAAGAMRRAAGLKKLPPRGACPQAAPLPYQPLIGPRELSHGGAARPRLAPSHAPERAVPHAGRPPLPLPAPRPQRELSDVEAKSSEFAARLEHERSKLDAYGGELAAVDKAHAGGPWPRGPGALGPAGRPPLRAPRAADRGL